MVKRYCSYCSAEMIFSKIGAESVNTYVPLIDASYPLGSKYDKKTGERQYAPHFKCPNFKQKKWYQIVSPHDEFSICKIIK